MEEEPNFNWSKVFDAVDEGIAIIDTEYTIIAVNKAFAKIVRRPQEKLKEKKCYQVINGTDKASYSCTIIETLKTKKPATIEVDEPHLNNLSLKMRSYPLLDNKNEVKWIIYSITDRTQQKKDKKTIHECQAKLKKALENLQEMKRVKTDIIANISHEFKTPITIASTSIELVRDENQDDEQDHLLIMAERALERLNNIVENLVTVADKFTGVQKLRHENLALEELVQGLCENFEKKALDRKITIKSDIPSDLPKIIGDPEALTQVFKNLLDNSIKFIGEDGGTIVISRSEEHTSELQSHSFISYAVFCLKKKTNTNI